MEAVARETRCNVNLGMRDRTSVVYIDTCRADLGNVYQPDIGSTRPLLRTSIGRALILAGAARERAAILNRLKVEDPERFAVDKPLWEAELKAFAQRGYCYSRGDWRKEVHAIAVPIRRTPREEPAALNCTSTSRRASQEALEKRVAPRLLDAVHQIENALGASC
jgi:DNA-binding IclR family transcriptional regulator